MSRTNKGTKAPGHEYWSRRPGNRNGSIPGRVTKRRTHKAERVVGKIISNQVQLPAESSKIVDQEFWSLLL